jgi:hypothetical protein
MKTLVSFLLDRTGSMIRVKTETINAFNSYLNALGEDPNIEFTLVLFDAISMDKVCVKAKLNEVPRLTDKNYVPRDYTNLLECATRLINAVEELNLPADEYRPPILVLQTDGMENASDPEKYTFPALKALIDAKTALGWQFVFMGCGIDNYDAGARMGISRGQTLSYGTEAAAMGSAFGATAQNTRAYASGLTGQTTYTAEQKFAAGDQFDPDAQKAAQKPVTPPKSTMPKMGIFKTQNRAEDFSLKDKEE